MAKMIEIYPGYAVPMSRETNAVKASYRSVWLNMHLGGFHWRHNDPTDDNLLASHRCPECRAFRDSVWPWGPRFEGIAA